jgi:hypothetical protein
MFSLAGEFPASPGDFAFRRDNREHKDHPFTGF